MLWIVSTRLTSTFTIFPLLHSVWKDQNNLALDDFNQLNIAIY